MAPEIISGKQYDAKADIWSFGITAIELCQGRAPRSRDTPAKVLLRTCVYFSQLHVFLSNFGTVYAIFTKSIPIFHFEC